MPHFPKPFYRSARGAWFVQIGARQIKLDSDREVAFQRYHELMAQQRLQHASYQSPRSGWRFSRDTAK
jgi:hypothetical protein